MALAETSSYADLYDLMPDSLQDEYAGYLNMFDSESPYAPAALRDMLLNAGGDTPKVFLYLTSLPSPVIKVAHRVSRYAPALGAPTDWDDSVFAFGSDVGPGNQVTLVNFPAGEAFGRTAHVRVPTMAGFTAAWSANEGADCVGPYQDNDPDTEMVRTRFFAPVPKEYASVVIRRGRFTPEELWTELGALILADNRGQMCAPLLKWIRIAGTYSGPSEAPGDAPMPPTNTVVPLTAPLSDAQLQLRLWGWLTADLPALAHRTGTTTGAMTATLDAMRAEFARQREDASAARVASKLPKTMSAKYPEASDGLRRLCEVASDEDLPPFWRTYATLSKKEGIFALSQALDQRAANDGSAGHAPIATPALFERISQFSFGTRDVDNLTAGLSPFLVCTGLNQDAAHARDQAVIYQLVYAGSAAPTLDQLRQLVSSAPSMPATMLGLMVTFKGYSVLLDVILGVEHRLSVAFRSFVSTWEKVMLDVEVAFGGQIGAVVPLFLRFVQLSCIQFFNAAVLLGTVASLPPLGQLITCVQYRNWQSLPPLPGHYFQPAPPAAPPGGGAPVLPAPSQQRRPPGSPAGTPAGTQVSVTNVRPDRALMSRFERCNTALRTLTSHESAVPLPMNEANTSQLCLSYCLRGSCFSGCQRTTTHRLLTSSEKATVDAWLTRVGVE